MIYISQINQIKEQKKLIIYITVLFLIGTIAMSALLSYFLSGNLSKPVSLLVTYIKDISRGNFGVDINIKSENEIGVLSTSIQKNGR